MKTLLAFLLVALPFFAFCQQANDPANVITVTGTAEVFATPDEATVRLGIQQQAGTAQEAQNEANAVIQKLLTSLKSLGIQKENIQTSRMALNPVYSNPRAGETMRITGYQAQDVLAVRLTNFDLVGKVIDSGVTAGVNNVEGIDFRLRNSRGPRAAAYKDAVADARSKADAIAEAMGVKISGVYDVRADTGFTPAPRMMGGFERADMMAAAAPVEPGQMEVSVTVTIRYRIN